MVYRIIWVTWNKTRASRASQKAVLVMLKHFIMWGPSEKKKNTLLRTLSQAARKTITLRWPGEASGKLE